MKPSQTAAALRRIADKLDASKNPDRKLVNAEIRRVLAAVVPVAAPSRAPNVPGGMENAALMEWLLEVLKHQTSGATIVLQDGGEAMVQMEGNDLIAVTYDDSPEQTYHARIRFVPIKTPYG